MSSGFLGTFLLNNFLRETYSAKKSELEERIENFLNKEVDLGDYSGMRFLGISLGNSKIIDKKNIDSEIKAKNVYVGIMPLRSLLNQKWIIKIKPEKTEINIDRDFFKREKPYLSYKNISKSKFKYDLNFNLSNYSPLKLKEIGVDTKVKGHLIYKSSDKQIIGNIKSNFEERGKLIFKFNKKLNKEFLKFEVLSNGIKLGLSEYYVGNRQFSLKEGEFKSNLKFHKKSNQTICKGGFSLNKIKLNTSVLQENINSDSLNFVCEQNNLIANNLSIKYGSLISDFNLNIPLNQKNNKNNKIDLTGIIKFEDSSNPDLDLSVGEIEYWIDKKGINFGKLNSKFVLNRTQLENLNIFKERGISGFVSAEGDIGGSINKPELSVSFDIDYPKYKNLINKEIWEGTIDNKNEVYKIELVNNKSRSSPVPTFITLKFDSNLKFNKANIRRLFLYKRELNEGNLNMVRKGDEINWNANNFPLNEIRIALGNDNFDRVSGNINGTGFFSLKDSFYNGRLVWRLGEYRNIKFSNSLFSFNFKDENYDLNASLYPNNGGIIEINNDSSNKNFFDISFENVSTDWTLLTAVDILDVDNNQISKNKNSEELKKLNKKPIRKNKRAEKLKTFNIDLNNKSFEEKINFISDYNDSNLDSGDKYGLKKLINKFDGRYNGKFIFDTTEKDNYKIKNANLDGTIELNKNNSFSKKEKISLRFNGGLSKGDGKLNVDKIPLKTFNLLLDKPIDFNGSLKFDLIYNIEKNLLEIKDINSINTSVNGNKFKFTKGNVELKEQIFKPDLELKYDNSNNPLFLRGSIPLKNKSVKDSGLILVGDKELIDIIDDLSGDYFNFKKGKVFYTFRIKGSIDEPKIIGRFNIIDSEVDFLETSLRNINGLITWQFYEKDSKIISEIRIIDEFKAEDEDKGTISIKGLLPVYLKDNEIDKKISIKTENLNLVAENFNYIYDSNLDISGSLVKPVFSGDMTFKNGFYKLKNINLENKEKRRDWEELNWNYKDLKSKVKPIEIISDETPFSLFELRKIIPSYLQNFGFDNLKLKLGPNFRLEYLNIIKTQLSTESPGIDLKINGKIKEFVSKEEDENRCGSLSLQGRINLTNGIANLFTTPFKLNKNNDNHIAFASRSCLVPLLNFSLISKVPEPIRKINQNNKEIDSSNDSSTNDNSRDFAAIGIGNSKLIRIEASYFGYLDELRSTNNIFLRSTPSYNRSEIIGLMGLNSANFINRTFISQINNSDGFSERFQFSLYPALINDSMNNIYSDDNLDLENSESPTSSIGESSEEWITEIGFDIDSWINFAVQTIPGRDDIPPKGILTLQSSDFFNEKIDLEVTGSTDSKGDWKSQFQLFYRY